jgi:hypothetical protein
LFGFKKLTIPFFSELAIDSEEKALKPNQNPFAGAPSGSSNKPEHLVWEINQPVHPVY